MLREIGLATPLLVIIVIVLLVAVLTQTTEFGVFSSASVGVTDETALTWGQTTDEMADTEDADDEEAEQESTPEVEATEEPDN